MAYHLLLNIRRKVSCLYIPAQTLASITPSARGIVAPNGSHAWCLQFPDLFADTVRAWVTDNPLPSILLPM
jgi:hypothetical protein